MDQNQKQALREIQQLQLMAIDLNLYLDTHPQDRNALTEYNKIVQKLNKSKKAYASMYGPLTNFGDALSKCHWQWIEAPWPWQV